MPPKKILYLDNSFTFGGAIISLSYLLKGIDVKKYQPIIVTAQPENVIKSYFGDFTASHIKIKLKWHNNSMYRRVTSLPFSKIKTVKKTIEMVRFVYWLMFIYIPEALKHYAIGKKYNVDLVHLNNIMGSQLPGILAAKLLRVPCVAHLRAFEEVSVSSKFYARLIEHHIAISSSIKKNLLSLEVPNDKITLVYDAVDLSDFDNTYDVEPLKKEFSIKSCTPMFGIFGRIINWKGTKEFVQSASLVFKKIPKAKAFVVGGISDGSKKYMAEVESLAKKEGVLDKIVFTGYREDIPALMKLMDVVVLASITPEPFGMVVIEAMAMEKPVVATRAGGPLDSVLDGKTGFLVPMKEPNEMAAALIKILKNPVLAKKMGMSGRKRVEKIFCKERYARQVEDIYFSLIRN